MRTIKTERLKITPVDGSKADILWEVLQQPDLREYQDLPDVDLEQFRRMVASRPPSLQLGAFGRFEWLVFLEGIAGPVGWVSLRIGERTTNTAELGYSVVAAYRGRGIATEAVQALVDESFGVLQLRRLRAYCMPDNTASRAVLKRAGFEGDGVLPHGATVQGRAVDVLAHVLERDDWERSRRIT